MSVERSAGAVIFRKTKKGAEYLLLHHHPAKKENKRKLRDGHWSFPKGHIEHGEKTKDTVFREVKEETGIMEFDCIPGFKETIRYFVNANGERRLKFVAFLLARVRQKKITLSYEHQEYAWLSFLKAYHQLTHAGDKNVLKKAHEFLSRKSV